MIINSQFFITHYNGKSPLTLKVVPLELSEEGKIVYNKFIQSIGAIYSSQTSDGRILKFWTTLKETTDQLGNKKYSYVPHPDSTLETLDSTKSYYFIVRDTSFLPITIPTVGGTVTSLADPSILPIIKDIPFIALTNNTGNNYFYDIKVENLQINESYKYKFNCINSNWPANITPISGVLKSPNTSGVIQSVLTLFPTTENCSSISNLNYNIPASCLVNNFNEKRITMQLEITPQSYSGEPVLSNQFSIACYGCLPNVDLSSNTDDTNRKKNNSEILSLTFNNLSKDRTYTYAIETINANWPYYVSHPTGILKVTSNTEIVKLDGVFCSPIEQYPSNANNILPYTAQSNNITKQSWYKPSVTLRAVVRDQNNTNIIHYSNILKLSCQNYAQQGPVTVSLEVKDIQ